MARAKRWRPLTYTKDDFEWALKRMAAMPEEVIPLFSARADRKKARACITKCEEILEKDPECIMAMMYLGTIYHEQKHYKKGIDILDKAVAVTPVLYQIWHTKGECEIMLRRYRAARFSFMRVVELNPRDAYAYGLVALTYYCGGHKERAISFIEDVIKSGRLEDPKLLLHMRAMLEEKMGNTREAFMHYLESQMMSTDTDAMTAVKIGMLAAEKEGDGEE